MNTSRERQLIRFLANRDDWISSSLLSEHFKITRRTIRSYIAKLNHQYNNIIISSELGYKINKREAILLLESENNLDIPSNYNDRKKFILESILLSHQSPTLDFLAEKSCIALSTLKNEISRLRKELDQFNLNLTQINGKISIIGLERDKHKLLLNLIYEELENSSFSLESIQNLFVDVNLYDIKNIVINALKENKYFLDNYSLLNYILHIAIFITQNKYQKKNIPRDKQKYNFKEVGPAKVVQIFEEVFRDINKKFNLNFTIEDFFEVSLSLITSAVSDDLNQLEIDQLEKLVGKEINDLIYEIIYSVRDTYAIDIREDKFMIRFAFHIKKIIERKENNINIRNNEFNKIKSEFPFIYLIAVFISNIINKKTNHILSEDEISFIALHIGVLMEEKRAYSAKLKCAVLAPEYYIVNRSLSKKLDESFSENLVITNFISSIDEINKSTTYELLLSTIEINNIPLEIPYIIIDPFLSEKSVKNIINKIEHIKQLKFKQRAANQFKYFFRKDLFFYDYPFKTHYDVIEYICDYMIEKCYVDKDYKEAIYEHEKVAPSSYGKLAIPHPLSNNAISSLIAIAINPEPIQWGSNKVNIVFMLSFQEKDSYLFKDIFNSISQMIMNKESFKAFMEAKTLEEFLDILVNQQID